MHFTGRRSMSLLRHLYEQATPVEASWGHHRIFAQAAYGIVRTTQFAPVIMAEAQDLARWFPLCWRRDASGEPVLVVFRSLLEDGQGYPGDASYREDCLPLVFKAFPLVVPDRDSIEQRQVLADRVICDKPTDIGAPLLTPEGKFTPAALARARLAIDVARGLPATTAFSRALGDNGLLEPWVVDLDIGRGRRARFDDLLILATSRLDDPVLHGLVAEHGAEAGLLLAVHRLSLFRMSALLTAARRDVQKAAVPAPAPLDEALSLP